MSYNFNGMIIRKLERKKGITDKKTKYYLGALKKDNWEQIEPMIYISSIYKNDVFEYKGIFYQIQANGEIKPL